MNVRTENSLFNSLYENKIKRVDPVNPDPAVIDLAVSVIKRGGVVVFPARSMYGLAADALNHEAVGKIFEMKKRPYSKPLLVLIPADYDLSQIVLEIPEKAKKIMDKFWPGFITIVLKAKAHLPAVLTAGTGRIGIRKPGNPVAAQLVNLAGFPLTGTSANISDMDSCSRISDLPAEILESADLVLDAGELLGGAGSTVIDATSDKIRILREGNLSASILASFI